MHIYIEEAKFLPSLQLSSYEGYHYDWTERRYHPKSYTPFPSALAAICSQIGEALGDEHSVIAEAAIVNFYPVSDLQFQ
jgi:alkylated DNA repair dioxygenase AlkB